MSQIVRRPASVSVAGYLLLGEAVFSVVAILWAANMSGHDLEPSTFFVPGVVIPLAMAIIGKLLLSGFRIARYAYWLLVLGCTGAMFWLGRENATGCETMLADLIAGVFLFRRNANAFFAGRDYRRHYEPEPEADAIREPHAPPTPQAAPAPETPAQPEVKVTISPRISPRGSRPAV